MFKEFRDFALRGNVVDLAVGFLIGGGIAPIARSLVDDILMPPIGLLLGNVNFEDLFLVLRNGSGEGSYATRQAALDAGAVIVAYGKFINTCITFMIVAWAAFLFVKLINRLHRKEDKSIAAQVIEQRSCPFCFSKIADRATRCPQCTSALELP